jgi:hypothetical protein
MRGRGIHQLPSAVYLDPEIINNTLILLARAAVTIQQVSLLKI